MLGAVKGLEALTRQNPKIDWSEALKVRLRQLAVSGSRALKPAADDLDARIRRLAMMALRNARDYDIHTLRATLADSDWQVRRLVAMSLNLTDPDQVPGRIALLLREVHGSSWGFALQKPRF